MEELQWRNHRSGRWEAASPEKRALMAIRISLRLSKIHSGTLPVPEL